MANETKKIKETTMENTKLDTRSVLPIPEPTYPPITEVDVRNATPPPIFQVKAPEGAPNVLVILIDNLGYSASKTFGGHINMPTLERLAKDGLVCTNTHTAPLCSPSRTALLTGRNTHSVNMRAISEFSTAFPGMTSVRPQSKAPLPQILRLNGYSTAYFGKSHEFTPWETGITGPFDSWPTGWGFERFYGSIGGEADMFAPPLHDNTTLVDLPNDPDYYYQTDVANKAISWARAQKTMTPDKPFFIYYPTPGTHSPAQVPAEWRDKYKGKFDMGWDKAREQTLARQKELGIVPANTQLTSKPKEMPDWDTLSADQKKVYTRHQEIFAAYTEITDYEVGRLVQAIDDLGVMDNTLIIYCTGDNGSSANGGVDGRFNTFASFNQVPETLEDQLKNLDRFGGPDSELTPPIGWAIADNTPFAYAQGNTSYGGITNGVVIHWPKGIKAKGEIRPQFHHLIDIAPTVLEAVGLPEPEIVNGTPQSPMEGVSMCYLFEDGGAKTRHTVQYFEFQGNAGLYKDGWYANGLHKVAWEATPRAALGKGEKFLFNTAEDFSCANNLIEKYPDKFKEMWDTFLTEAVKYNVLPLDDRTYERFNPAVAGRPDTMAGRKSLTVYEGMVGMKENSFINTKNQSYSVTAELVVPEGGVNGVILAQGGHHAGWSLYVKEGRPQFAYNFLQHVTTIDSPEPLPAGRVTVKYDFAYDGGKPGAGGTGTIFINGKKVASGRIERTIPFLFGVETADVGMDLYTPVTNAYEKGNNKFTGKIEKVTIDQTDRSSDVAADHEECEKLCEGIQPSKVEVSSVHHIAGSRFGNQDVQGIDVVDFPVCDLDECGDAAFQVYDHPHGPSHSGHLCAAKSLSRCRCKHVCSGDQPITLTSMLEN
ncbi:MAG: arylsulfatase [Syntrophorhabdales bacterium]|jgi:arylsulfatase